VIRLLLLALFLFPAPANPSADSEIARLRSEWARNLHEKNVAQSVAEYAEDADFLQPDGTRVEGRAAIQSLFETVTATFDSTLVFTSVHVEQSGGLAFDSGTYRETLVTRSTGKSVDTRGSYLTVYRRSKSGEWLIVEQMWAAAPESGAAAGFESDGGDVYLSRATTKSGTQSSARLNSESSMGMSASRLRCA
jgi:ketosteroid isomerase-like protein